MTEPKRIRPRRISESFVVQIQVENGIAQNYLTATQVTKKHSIGRAWVKRLAQHGRIPGAFKMGNTWCIPVVLLHRHYLLLNRPLKVRTQFADGLPGKSR